MRIQLGTYANESVTYVAGTRTITVNNFFENFGLSNIVLISINKGITTGTTNQSLVIGAPGMWRCKITSLGSGSYQIEYSSSFRALESDDEIYITVDIMDETKDYDVGAVKILNQNPEWSHYSDQLELSDVTNQASGTTRNVIYANGFKNHFIALIGSIGTDNVVTITFEVPGKSDCVDTDDVSWIDVTELLIGQSSFVIDSNQTTLSEVIFIDTSFIFERIKVKAVFTNGGTATNTLTISHKMA